MKIAVVGKGGSGKSTITALLSRYLIGKGDHAVVIDADINMHLGMLLGTAYEEQLALSRESNARSIRTHLKGSNPRIKRVEEFIKTTPPGDGSRLIQLSDADPIVTKFSRDLSVHGHHGFFMYVGTYEEEGIGISCYHGNLSILENILSHTVLKKDEWVIVDMVAGIDAFSNTLHAQFDAILLVVEPTPEGVAVFKQYKKFGTVAHVFDSVFVIGNKVADATDVAYLKKHIGSKLLASFPFLSSLRRARQEGK